MSEDCAGVYDFGPVGVKEMSLPGDIGLDLRGRGAAVSKIFTLNKLHLLEKLASAAVSSAVPSADYFHAGNPITNPPRVRGSMVLQLNHRFLEDNADHFQSGSPVDTGAIRFGLLRPADGMSFLDRLPCDHRKFSRLISELDRLSPAARSRVACHQRTPEAEGILAAHFHQTVVDFMLGTDDPAAWSFEFSLRSGYRLEAEHIEELLFPNTYANTPLFRRIRSRIGNRARPYNPMIGLENRHLRTVRPSRRRSDLPPSETLPDYRVVGVYEDFRLDVFPTHALPIVASVATAGFTRWNYLIEPSYRFRLLGAVGQVQCSPEKLFPVFTYRSCTPRRFSDTCQVIALSPSEVVVSTSRVEILATLLVAAARNFHDLGYLGRAWKTGRNCLTAREAPISSHAAAIAQWLRDRMRKMIYSWKGRAAGTA